MSLRITGNVAVRSGSGSTPGDNSPQEWYVKFWFASQFVSNVTDFVNLSSMTFNATNPQWLGSYSTGGWSTGDLIWIIDDPTTGGITTFNSGMWVLGSVATPSAIPLTRHPQFPATGILPAGSKITARRSFDEQTFGCEMNEFTYFDPVTDTVRVYIPDGLPIDQGRPQSGSRYTIRLPNGGVMPGGLFRNTEYWIINVTSSIPSGGNTPIYDFQLSLDNIDPVDITSAGSPDPGYYDGGAKFDCIDQKFLTYNAAIINSLEIDIATMNDIGAFRVDVGSVVTPPNTPANTGITSVAWGGTASGYNSISSGDGIAIGAFSAAGLSSIAIGVGAKVYDSAGIGVGGSVNVQGISAGFGRGARTFNNGEISFGSWQIDLQAPAGRRTIHTAVSTPAGSGETPAKGGLGEFYLMENGFVLYRNMGFAFNGLIIAKSTDNSQMASWAVSGFMSYDSNTNPQCVSTVTLVSTTSGEANDWQVRFAANVTSGRIEMLVTPGTTLDVEWWGSLDAFGIDTDYWNTANWPSPTMVPPASGSSGFIPFLLMGV